MQRELPKITAHERMDYKRCVKKWYWHWRAGLVPRNKTFGPLDLGSWFHDGLADWYQAGSERGGDLRELVAAHAGQAIQEAIEAGAPEHIIEPAEEMAVMAEAMAVAYQAYYGDDEEINVLFPEFALDFEIADEDDNVIAIHKLRPDLVYIDKAGHVWLMEHKTAKSISTDHLPIDDQARPYGSMAEPALRKMGVIEGRQQFRGIMYNFIRKTLPDDRPQNAEGLYLNQNGTVSKRQPPPQFVRKPVALSARAKLITLRRVQAETRTITTVTLALRAKEIHPLMLPKTPHKSCSKTCQFFDMCVAEENGGDIRDMKRTMYKRENPYLYAEEHTSTDEHVGFEMG